MNHEVLSFARAMHEASPFTGSVLDVGAFDVNGALSSVLPVTWRVDMREGPGVDQVVDATKLVEAFGKESFDNVVSAEMLEHAEDWRGCMRAMWDVLKPGGKLLLTMASVRKGRHAYPDDYWRFPAETFVTLFGENEFLGAFDMRISIGVCVVKSGPLDLTAEPLRVP